MDAERFESLLCSLTAAGSRRGTLAAAVSGVLGLLGLAHPGDADAAKSGKCKPKCGECEKCKKGDCDKKNGKKRCKKGKCRAKADGTACSVGTCQGGFCTTPPPPPPPADPFAGTCTATQEDQCQDDDTVAANCNGTAGCSCYTRTTNTRFCGRRQSAYCLGPEATGCTSDADCLGDDACARVLEECTGCGGDPFCIPPCGS